MDPADWLHLVFFMAGAHKRGTPGTISYDDLVGEGWFALIKACEKWDGRGDFSKYAMAIIRWRMRDWLRKEVPWLQRHYLRDFWHAEGTRDEQETPDAFIVRPTDEIAEERDFVESLLRPMTNRGREIVTLYYLEGVEMPLIAKHLNRKENTCWIEQGRALRCARDAYTENSN